MTETNRKRLGKILYYGTPLVVFCSMLAYTTHQTNQQRAAAAMQMALATDKEKAVLGLIGSLDYVVVILNQRGEVVEWNPATEKLTGYSKAEMLGKTITPIIPEEMRKIHHAAFAAAFRDDAKLGKIQRVKCQVVRKDPAKKPVDVSVTVRVVKFGVEKFAIATIDRRSRITEIETPPADL